MKKTAITTMPLRDKETNKGGFIMCIRKSKNVKFILLMFFIPIIVCSISSFANAGSYTIGPSYPSVTPCNLAGAIDTSDVTTSSGLQNKKWTCSYSQYVYGGDSAYTSLSGQGQTWLTTNVQGPKLGYFYWKGGDLDFSIDGQELDENSQYYWNYRWFFIPSGTHTLSWHFQKNNNSNGGEAWVDRLSSFSWNEVTIGGYITKNGGFPISNVTIRAESDWPMGALIHCDSTDGNGYYSCKVPQSWKGRIRPYKKWSSFSPAYYPFSGAYNNNTSPDGYPFTCNGSFC
jgi:hypothetical protein